MVKVGLGKLRLSPSEFWGMSLPEFSLACEGYRIAQQDADYRLGILASLWANANRDEKKRSEPFIPADFYPSLPRPEKDSDKSLDDMTDEEVEVYFAQLEKAFAGSGVSH